jgi:hypothetical protein
MPSSFAIEQCDTMNDREHTNIRGFPPIEKVEKRNGEEKK